MGKQTVQRISKLIKIPVKEICYDGFWFGNVSGFQLKLEHKVAGIVLSVNGIERRCFQVSEQKITGGPLRNGAQFKDRRSRYYIVDNNKRYSHIYINKRTCGIGTRVGIEPRPRYDSNLLGHKQFKHWQECRMIETERKRKLRERNRRKKEQELQPTFSYFADRHAHEQGKNRGK
jgi:hypothetical protein